MEFSRMSTFMIAIALLLSTILLPTCAYNPVTGKKELSLMSTEQEIQLGKESDPAIVAQFGRYENETLQKFIDEKGKEMAAISHRPNLPYEFKILDSPVVNAFAVPGGYVYFTRGIMAHFNNEAEFAGVLGHEIGHITARHSAKQYTKQMVGQIAFIGLVVASKDFREYADVASTAMGLMFLKFSRSNESESDKLGVEYSTTVGYDADKMANFFNTLNRMSGGAEGRVPTMLSTHPDPGDRYNKVKQMAQKWQAKDPKTTYTVNRNEYLSMIDGLVYGEDPRQGYVADGSFFHPELKFQYPVPRDWQLVNSPSQVQMAPKDGNALMALKIAQGQSLDQAAQAFVTDNKLTLNTSQNKNINGFNAIRIEAVQPSQQDQSGNQTAELKILSYFYLYNGLIYQIFGVTKTSDYFTYSGSFEGTMRNFKSLTDQARINVKPDRIKVVTVKKSESLRSLLTTYDTPADRMEEVALINSMQLGDQLKAGDKVKVLGK